MRREFDSPLVPSVTKDEDDNMIDDTFITLFLCGLAAGGGVLGGQLYRLGHNSTLETRCAIACTAPGDAGDWNDDAHVCVCEDGSVFHIRTVVEPLRQGRETH